MTPAPEPTQWQPIETAPKDKRILLFTKRYTSNVVWIGRWNRDRYANNPRPYWDIYGWKTTDSRNSNPTHWMPLPEPPPPPDGDADAP